MKTESTMRLNKFLARAGFGSRRAVEDIIRQGRVKIDDQTVHDLGRQVDPEAHSVTVDGIPAFLPQDYRVYAFNKPVDVVSTLKPQGSQPGLLAYRNQADLPDRFVPVGRLDAESTGLLLWTDDGTLNQELARPKGAIWKTYEVELSDPPSHSDIVKLTTGKISIDGRPCLPCKLELAEDQTTRHYVMQLHEGRRRQIRRMFKSLHIKVLKLHRTDIGPIGLGKLRPGDFRRLNHTEETELRKSVAQNHQGSSRNKK